MRTAVRSDVAAASSWQVGQLLEAEICAEEAFIDTFIPVEVVENDRDRGVCQCRMTPFDSKDAADSAMASWEWHQLHVPRAGKEEEEGAWKAGDAVHVQIVLPGMDFAVWKKATVLRVSDEGHYVVSCRAWDGDEVLEEEHVIDASRVSVRSASAQEVAAAEPVAQKVAEQKRRRGGGRRPKACQTCGGNRIRCCITGCVHFCWKCAGYPSDFPDDELKYPGTNVPIKLYRFCADHMDEGGAYKRYLTRLNDNDNDDDPMLMAEFILRHQVAEAEALVRLFGAQERPFDLVPVDADGWCIFGSVAKATGTALGALIESLQVYVSAEEHREDVLNIVVEEPETVLGQIHDLSVDDPDSVQELWSGAGGDILVPLLAGYLNCSQRPRSSYQIVVWRISPTGELTTKDADKYPEGNGGADTFANTINLLRINDIVPHYCILRPRAHS